MVHANRPDGPKRAGFSRLLEDKTFRIAAVAFALIVFAIILGVAASAMSRPVAEPARNISNQIQGGQRCASLTNGSGYEYVIRSVSANGSSVIVINSTITRATGSGDAAYMRTTAVNGIESATTGVGGPIGAVRFITELDGNFACLRSFVSMNLEGKEEIQEMSCEGPVDFVEICSEGMTAAGTEDVTVAAGTFAASKYSAQGNATVWVARDMPLPLLMTSDDLRTELVYFKKVA